MGITTYLFHKSDSLEKQRFNMFFLDMGENIHFHYRDLRIELSVGEFIELAELFNRYAKDVMTEINGGYKDGVLANTNEAGTLKTFWDKEKKLENPVRYHERQLAVEETKDGYHLHIRNYKILLYKESFKNLVKAIAPILPLLESGELKRDPLLLLEQNDLKHRLISRVQTEDTDELLIEVEKTFKNKAGQVLRAIGFTAKKRKDGSVIYTNGSTTITVVLPSSSSRSHNDIAVPGAGEKGPVRLDVFLERRGRDLEPERLNELKLKILFLLKKAENGDIAPFRLEHIYIDSEKNHPVVDLFCHDETINPQDEVDKFSKLLSKFKLFFIKPPKEYFSKEQREVIEDRFFSFVMENLASHQCVRKIYVLGSSTHHALGRYRVPFVHFDWVKLKSDFDIYIEFDPDSDSDIPKEWQKKFYWDRAGSDYYHFGDLGDGMSSQYAKNYPYLQFYEHLIEGYLFDPNSGDKKKKDKWFAEVKAKCIFSRDRIAQWIGEHYDIEPAETERFNVASFNRVYHVQSASSDYVLKIYDSKHLSVKNLKKISYEIAVLDSLKNSGIEVALPVKNRSGGYITANEKEKAALFTFAPGKYVAEPDLGQIQLAGNLLARFHIAGKQFKTKHAKNYSNKDTVLYWLKAWKEYHDKNVIGTDLPFNLHKYQRILKELKTYPTHCHGDLSQINYLFEIDRCWLIDFQSIGYGPALIDLANGMVEFSARKKQFLMENLDAFQAGYESARQLSRSEKDNLVDLVLIQLVARQAKLIRLHYGGYGYELKEERILGLREGVRQILQL